jgi:hypothetical protein
MIKDLVDFGFFPLTVLKESDKEGRIWDVRIIQSGWSLNEVFYSPEVLKQSAPLFEGVKVFAFQFNDKEFNHLPDPIVDFHKEGFSRNVAGFVDNVRYIEGEGLVGKLHVTDDFFKMTFKNSWQAGKRDLLGFSIDARGRISLGIAEGHKGKIAEEIKQVNSLDIVTHPAAGGELLRMVASQGVKKMDKLIEFLKENFQLLGIKESKELEGKTDEQIIESLVSVLEAKNGDKKKMNMDDVKNKVKESTEKVEEMLLKMSEMLKEKKLDDAVALLASTLQAEPTKPENDPEPNEPSEPTEPAEPTEPTEPENDPEPTEPTPDEKVAEALKQLQQERSDMLVESILNKETILPQDAKDKIKKHFKDQIVAEDVIQEAIKDEKEYLAKFSESFKVNNMELDNTHLTTGLTPADRRQIAMHKMFGLEPTDEEKDAWSKVPAFKGLKESYIEFTGDADVRGNTGITSMKEAVSSDFPQALGTSMERRLLREYTQFPINESWRKFVTIESIDNFKTQDRIQIGGLADLPTVAENGTYTEFTSPNEVKASYAATKKGKILVVTWEMVKNDDLRMITRLVSEMGRAAARTLGKFVYDLVLNVSGGVINAGTIYDSTALYTSGHSNLTTNALAYDSLDAGIIAMMNQTQPDSSEPLGIRSKYLLVPGELRGTAKVMVESEKIPISSGPGTQESINPNFGRVEPIVIPNGFLRSDKNNWYLIADPKDVESIVIGFLDGKENPEIFLQDQPTVATVFTNDQIKYKVRHVYNGVVTDYRGFYGGIVTGLS